MKPWFKAHDDEGVDRIVLSVVDRFKQSGLSGDEWRYSVDVSFHRKGKEVYRTHYGKMQWAIMALAYEWMTWPEKSPTPMWGLDEKQCAQYGCAEPAEVVYRLKEEFSAQGEGPIPDTLHNCRRAYCAKHRERGDSDREDCMDNYEVVGDNEVTP